MMRTTLLAVLGLTIASAAPAQIRCDAALAFSQVDRDAPGGRTPVFRTTSGRSALLFREKLNVNTDGTPRSYAVDDVFGRRRALNNMCNAMTDICRGLTRAQLAARAAAVAEADARGWPAGSIARVKLSTSVIAMRGGKPCPSRDGFLLSATSLQNPAVADVCSPDRYVDALHVAALVLPLGSTGFRAAGARVGDLVAAIAPGGEPIFAVVGDSGPATALGEGSIALNGRLKALGRDPGNYRDVLRNWVTGRVAVLVFPGSRDRQQPFMDQARIDAAAASLLAEWGGKARLAACLANPG
ncbi:hypothetical protein IP88_01220 [alpha proteobacterium AAP81b]|nr:hypothetical protein IP88_01220 [alpha proteobacterium AAP81b]